MNGDSAPMEEVDLLIVGAGPAGASLACFLAEYGKVDEELGSATDMSKDILES